MSKDLRKFCALAMLSALAYIVMVFGRVPVTLFLSYEPKDVVITIGGFLYGPMAALAMTVVVAFVEMVTVSETGYVGLVMNIISGAAFACTASYIYKKKRDMAGAVCGLGVAWVLTTVVMVLWNYLMMPIFLEIERAEVVGLLLPAIIPFNLLKGGLNAAFIILLYKPVKAGLLASRLMPPQDDPGKKGRLNWGIIIAAIFIIITCVLWVLALQGRL